MLDLNSASREQLESLPGIGEVFAERIVNYRRSRGGFKQAGELKNIPGIGDKRFARIRPYIEVRSDHAR
jgi:competence protein ComEA